MSRHEKNRMRLANRPRDYTYSEARTLLSSLGFKEYNSGKTSGSRVYFYREFDGKKIMLHKPHPGDVMSPGAIDDLAHYLHELGEI